MNSMEYEFFSLPSIKPQIISISWLITLFKFQWHVHRVHFDVIYNNWICAVNKSTIKTNVTYVVNLKYKCNHFHRSIGDLMVVSINIQLKPCLSIVWIVIGCSVSTKFNIQSAHRIEKVLCHWECYVLTNCVEFRCRKSAPWCNLIIQSTRKGVLTVDP